MNKSDKNEINLSGLNVQYYRLGSGPALLFLHGGRTRAQTYRKLLDKLSKNYDVIAPDIPGFGASGTPVEIWSFKEYAKFFDKLLDHLQLDKVTAVGYSMGGGIAVNLAAMSDRVTRLELIDASGIQFKDSKHGYQDLRRLKFYMANPRFIGAFLMLVREYIQFHWKHRSDLSHMHAIRFACFSTDYDREIRRVKIPTKLLWGKDDWVYPLSVARSYKKLIKKSEIVIVNGIHDWPVYDPLLYR